jgi:hypothetical protein
MPNSELPRKQVRGSVLGLERAHSISRIGPFARDSERFVIRLLIGGIKKPR